MFDKIFARFKGSPPTQAEPRVLAHPKDLRVGDVIQIGDFRPEIAPFSRGEFIISAVQGLDIDQRAGAERRMLRLDFPYPSRGWSYWMWTEEANVGAAAPLALAIEMPQEDVLRRIDGAAFGQMFAPDRSYLVRLPPTDQEHLIIDPVVATNGYREVAAQQAYITIGDPSQLGTNNTITENDQAIDWYRLESDDRLHAIEAYVHDGGRTDVLFITYHPLRRIEQMLPGAA